MKKHIIIGLLLMGIVTSLCSFEVSAATMSPTPTPTSTPATTTPTATTAIPTVSITMAQTGEGINQEISSIMSAMSAIGILPNQPAGTLLCYANVYVNGILNNTFNIVALAGGYLQVGGTVSQTPYSPSVPTTTPTPTSTSTTQSPTISNATVQNGQTSLTLPGGAPLYIYGFVTGGGFPSGSFVNDDYASVKDVDGYLIADMAVTTNNTNSYTTQTAYYNIGGVSVSGYSSYAASSGSNSGAAAGSAQDTFSVATLGSLVVVLALAGGEQSQTLSGIPNITIDATNNGEAGLPVIVTIAHAYPSPGNYTIVEQTTQSAVGQDPNHAGDLIGVLVFAPTTQSSTTTTYTTTTPATITTKTSTTQNSPTTASTTTIKASTTTSTSVDLTSIAITSSTSRNLIVGSYQQFMAMGIYSNGTTQNISSQVIWDSSNPGIAIISSSGLITGVATGSTNITAKLSKITSNSVNLMVNVSNSQLQATFSALKQLNPNSNIELNYPSLPLSDLGSIGNNPQSTSGQVTQDEIEEITYFVNGVINALPGNAVGSGVSLPGDLSTTGVLIQDAYFNRIATIQTEGASLVGLSTIPYQDVMDIIGIPKGITDAEFIISTAGLPGILYIGAVNSAAILLQLIPTFTYSFSPKPITLANGQAQITLFVTSPYLPIADFINAITHSSGGSAFTSGTITLGSISLSPASTSTASSNTPQAVVGTFPVFLSLIPQFSSNESSPFTSSTINEGITLGTLGSATADGKNLSINPTLLLTGSNGTLTILYTPSLDPAEDFDIIQAAEPLTSTSITPTPSQNTDTYTYTTHNVTFKESGLASGVVWWNPLTWLNSVVSWSVTFNGQTKISNSNTIIFPGIANGQYSYSIGKVNGFISSLSPATITVNEDSTVAITFTP
jgi:Bacterial Ig-like domain (group 2)